jgi:predicted MFS family arabinose efflux permease
MQAVEARFSGGTLNLPLEGLRSLRSIGPLVLALATAMALGTLIGFAYGVLAPFLVDDLGLSAFQVGLLPSVMYATGAVLAPKVGSLTDRIGGRTALLALPMAVSAAFLVLAVAPGYPVVVASAVVGGLALGASNPTTNRVISEVVPAGVQGAATGWKQSGVSGGALLAGLLLPSAAAAWGWRGAVAATAVLPVVLVLAMARAVPRTPARAPAVRGADDDAPSRIPGLQLYALVLGVANGALAAYLVLFASTQAGFHPATAGLLAAVIGAVSVVARVVWAAAGERTGNPARLMQVVAGLGVVSIVVVGLAPVLGGWALWVGAVLVGLSLTSWQGLMMLTVVLFVSRPAVGAASGTAVRAFYSGYVIGPLLFGLAVDYTAPGWGLGWAGLVVACLAGIVVAGRMAARAR